MRKYPAKSVVIEWLFNIFYLDGCITKVQNKEDLNYSWDDFLDVDDKCAMANPCTIDGVDNIRDVLAKDYQNYAMLTYNYC